MKESELFQPIKDWLLLEKSMDKVYAEVGISDVVGLKDVGTKEEQAIIVELKLHLNFKVMEQAIRGSKGANYTYVAVPEPKSRHSYLAFEILENYGIGLLYVTSKGKVYERLEPKYNRPRYKKSKSVHEFNEQLIGGVKTGEDSLYKISIRNIQNYMESKLISGENDGWLSAQDIADNVKTHYSTPKPSIMATLQERWNQDWVETKKVKNRRYFRYKNKA